MDYLDDKNTPIGTTRSSELDIEGDGGVRETARDLKEQAMQRARSKGEEQKARATDEIQMLATALHEAGSKLDREDMASGRFINAAADRLESLSSRLDSRDVDGLVREGRQWARRNPTAFIGTAVAAGFIASRFLKASPDDEPEWDGYDREFPTALPGSSGYGTGVGADRSMATPAVTTPRSTTTPRTTTPSPTTPRTTTPGIGSSPKDKGTTTPGIGSSPENKGRS